MQENISKTKQGIISEFTASLGQTILKQGFSVILLIAAVVGLIYFGSIQFKSVDARMTTAQERIDKMQIDLNNCHEVNKTLSVNYATLRERVDRMLIEKGK